MSWAVKSRLKENWEAFENFTVDVIFGRREGKAASAFAVFLKTLSIIFAGLVKTRIFLYKHRIFRSEHLGCQVIIVGNLTVGGTGKTPVVEKLAGSLRDRGRKVAILSRGYKSKKEPVIKKWIRGISHTEPPEPKVVSDGKTVFLDSFSAGDEPYMLAKNLPGVIVIVDKDRVKAGYFAIKRYGVDTIILDDGFQYLSLKEHLQILLVDKSNPFGNGSLLPRGVLREPIRNLKRASYVFLTKSDGKRDPDLEALIHRYKPDTEIIECTHEPQYLQEVNGEKRLPLMELKGKKVAVFSGIAVPESFESYVQHNGAEIHFKKRFLDHHWFDEGELESVFKAALDGDLEMIVTTEKDSVRIAPDLVSPVPFYFLRVEVRILRGVDDFESAVSRICFPKRKMNATRRPFPRPGNAPGAETGTKSENGQKKG